MNQKKKILVTGAAGFIGYHLCESLLKLGHIVIGLDNINNYYESSLKYDRLKELGFSKEEAKNYNILTESKQHKNRMYFIRLNLEDRENLPIFFKSQKIETVCNLAAQAGVRYSITNPNVYIDSNINGFLNILECCRHNNISRFVYASSSSVYGNSKETPFKETHNVDNPISLYAATKKSNELMAYTYSHLYNLETIGLRFFTVYGPFGRPDMAYSIFTKSIIENKPIKVFNNGELSRDFTYIDDIVDGISKVILIDSKSDSLYKLYNIGNNKPVNLMDFIQSIESGLNKKALKKMYPMQQGDVNTTWADVSNLINDYDFMPNTDLSVGVSRFIDWYMNYYKN